MRGVRAESPDRFSIQLAALRKRSGLKRLFKPAPVLVDPWLVGQTVLAVMRLCPLRGLAGQRLLWNEYRVFLSQGDYQRLHALRDHLAHGLAELLSVEVGRLGAEAVGGLTVRVMPDEADELRDGQAVVQVAFRADVPDLSDVADDPDEMTVRVAGFGPTPVAPTKLSDPGPGLVASWPAGSQHLPGGRRVELGRPYRQAPAHHLALTGASARISKRQLWIEAHDGSAIIGRTLDGNPVQVGGRLLPPGGRVEVREFPVELSLSGGELRLVLAPPE